MKILFSRYRTALLEAPNVLFGLLVSFLLILLSLMSQNCNSWIAAAVSPFRLLSKLDALHADKRVAAVSSVTFVTSLTYTHAFMKTSEVPYMLYWPYIRCATINDRTMVSRC